MFRKWFLALGTVGLLASAALAGDPAPVVVEGPGCGADCCTKKCCMHTTEVKKESVRLYDHACNDLCLPKCGLHCLCNSLFNGWCPKNPCKARCGKGSCGSCGSCATCDSGPSCPTCTKCGHVCKQRQLVIKICHYDRTVNNCVAVEQPVTCCPAPCCGAATVPAGKEPPAKEGEKIGAPKTGMMQPMPSDGTPVIMNTPSPVLQQ